MELKILPLAEIHKKLGAKFMPFSGWNMPVQYVGIKEEHFAVRDCVGIFDVSHMGQLIVSGTDSLSFLNYISTNDVSKVNIGRAQYGLVLNHAGGVIDDIIIYRLTDNDYFICVNASNIDAVYNWFLDKIKEGNISTDESSRKPFQCSVKNLSSHYSQFAIQGPKAMMLLEAHFGPELTSMKRFNFTKIMEYSKPDMPCLLARTGYSGEDGCEIFLPTEYAETVWSSFFNTADRASIPLIPCGLGARDTLRLEACYPLHGHEIREDITPLSAGLDKFVSFEKGFFIGAPALDQQMHLGVSPVLIGLEVIDNGIIRADYPVQSADKTVGWVTSGTKTPTLNKALGLALVLPDFSKDGVELSVLVRDKKVAVKKIEIPFYKK